MNRWLGVVLASMWLGCAPLEAASDDEMGEVNAELSGTGAIGTALLTTGNLNLRSGAGPSHGILKVMPSGARVVTINRTTALNGFFNVSFNGVAGWASGTYLKLDSGMTPPPPPADGGTQSKGLWIWYFTY